MESIYSNLRNYKEAKICSRHFSKDSYVFALRLKPNAIPTIDVPYLVIFTSEDAESDSKNRTQVLFMEFMLLKV